MFLKQSTSVVISFGPFVDKTDGVTLETGLVSALDHGTTGIMLSKNGGTLTIRHATVTATTYDAHGNYKVTLDTTDTNTLGSLLVMYTDPATCLAVWKECTVLSANVYDSVVGGTDKLEVDTYQMGGNTLSATAGSNFYKYYAGNGYGPIICGGTVASTTGLVVTSTSASLPQVSDVLTGCVAIFRNPTAGVDGGPAIEAREITSYTYDSPLCQMTLSSTIGFTINTSTTFEIAPPGFFYTDRSKLSAVNTRVLLGIPSVAPANNGGLPTVNASNQIAGIAGTITTLDGLDTEQDFQHATTHGRLPTSLSSDGYIKADVLKFEGADPSDTVTSIVETTLDASDIELDEAALEAIATYVWAHLQAEVDPDTMGEAVVDIASVAAKVLTALVQDGLVWKWTANSLEDAPAPDGDIIANLNRAALLYGPNLSMVDYGGRTGITDINGVIIDENNMVYNTDTSSFDTLLDSIDWADAIISMTEVAGGDATGLAVYRASMPNITVGNYTVIVQEGVDQSAERLITELIFWDGQSVVPVSSVLSTTYNHIRTTSNLGTGSLAKVLTMTSHNGNPVPNVAVFVTLDSDGQNTIAGPMLTDDLGKVTFMLNQGSYYAWGNGLNTNIDNPKTFNVP